MSKQKNKRNDTVNRDVLTASVGRIYQHSAPLLICEALLFLVTGGIVLFWPVTILTILTFVIGVGLVLFGLYRTIGGFFISRNMGGGWLDVIFGLTNIVLGVLFCIYPVSSLIGVVYIFVVLFLFKSLRSLVFAINMFRARFGHYIFNLIMTLILTGVAVALLFYPMAGAIAVAYYLGIALILYAIFDVYTYIELYKLKRHIEY